VKEITLAFKVSTYHLCHLYNTDAVNGKDKSLHCQSCDQTTHLYCSGVTLTEYKAQSVNDSPYECPHCFKVHQRMTVTDLLYGRTV